MGRGFVIGAKVGGGMIKVTTLKRAYAKAVSEGKESFVIDDSGTPRELVTSYAKYLIEHLATLNVTDFRFTSSA